MINNWYLVLLSLGLLSLVGKEGPGISSLVLLVWVVVLTRAPAKWLSPICFFQLCHIAPSPSLPKKDGNGILCSLFTVLPHACGFPPKLARISARGRFLGLPQDFSSVTSCLSQGVIIF